MADRSTYFRNAAAIFATLLLFSADCLGGEFLRVKDTENSVKLQTAVFTYEKNITRVDLIGAIHIADRAYYEFLNKYFTTYEVLLFEMVGGEKLGGAGKRPPIAPPKEDAQAGENLEGLGIIYASLEKMLGLVGQAAFIDYFAENFVHADLTMEEFFTLQEERGESLVGFMSQLGLEGEKPKEKPSSFQLMRGLLTGRPDLVKLEMLKSLENSDSQLQALSGESVILTDRNRKCMEVMDREITKGRKNLGIFYGVAHFPDLEERLLERGFKRTSKKWLTAWRIPKR